jgi:hypothetical protein
MDPIMARMIPRPWVMQFITSWKTKLASRSTWREWAEAEILTPEGVHTVVVVVVVLVVEEDDEVAVAAVEKEEEVFVVDDFNNARSIS